MSWIFSQDEHLCATNVSSFYTLHYAPIVAGATNILGSTRKWHNNLKQNISNYICQQQIIRSRSRKIKKENPEKSNKTNNHGPNPNCFPRHGFCLSSCLTTDFGWSPFFQPNFNNLRSSPHFWKPLFEQAEFILDRVRYSKIYWLYPVLVLVLLAVETCRNKVKGVLFCRLLFTMDSQGEPICGSWCSCNKKANRSRNGFWSSWP